MSTAIWNAAAGTPTATHRIPVDTSGAGTPTMYTVQQVADLETSVGTSVNALGSIAVNTAIDLALGGFVSATIGANLTLSFTNPPAGGTEFTLVLTNGGAFTVTWPGSVTWAGATAPTLTASGVDVLHFASGNGGTNWYGWMETDYAVGTTAGTVAAGDDSRMTNDRTASGIRETSGPTLLVVGAIADGEYIKRVGSTAVGGTPASGGTPGGSTTQLQYNNAGAFGGMSGTAWDDTNRSLAITGATVTANKPVFDITQTFNNAAATMQVVNINLTNTASSSTSAVQQWQVNGATVARIQKDGLFRFNTVMALSGGVYFYTSGGGCVFYTGSGANLASSSVLSWSNSTGDPSATIDAQLVRDAANRVALRRTTNAQTLIVSGTYTDASNLVQAELAATSTAVTLSAVTAGTGADNVPVILTPAGTSQVEVGNGVQFTEMTAPSAPAANKVILFAQDNGAGKTQLMALFPSGAAQQVAIEP